MKFGLDITRRRIAYAIGSSLLVHALLLWGPEIRLPSFRPSIPTLTARLEALPGASAKPKTKPKARHRVKSAKPRQAPQATLPPAPPQALPVIASAPVAASAPAEAGPIASEADRAAAERPPLPAHAQLTFAIYKGTSHFRVGETVQTLDIKDGRYVLKATTRTIGLASLFKSYELNQYSNGVYGKYGLQPELFTEERIERVGTQRDAVMFDHATETAQFSDGREVDLPPDTQDILSNLYQFPPLANTEIAAVSVCNGRKIEQYRFGIYVDEEIDTPLGKMLTVRLHKLHAPNEEGLDIWLAREYRLFPVKMRFTESNGEVSAEAVITGMDVSAEQGARSNAVN